MAYSKPTTDLPKDTSKRKIQNLFVTESSKQRMSEETKQWNQSKEAKLSLKDSKGSGSASQASVKLLIEHCIKHPLINDSFSYVKTIGSGSYGTVIQLKNITDHKFYAMKLIMLKETDKEIEREVDILSNLNNEYVVRYHNSFNIPCKTLDIPEHIAIDSKGGSLDKYKVLCIHMEYCDQTLQQLIESKTLRKDKQLRLNITKELYQGVKYIHDKNVMHRDLKPTNIFLTTSGHVKIGDFGFARWHLDASSSVEDVNLFSSGLGTKFYRSPEIREGRNDYSIKVDLYSLGVISFELYYSFPTPEERDKILCELTENGMFPENFRSNSKASENIQNLIKRLLEHDSKKRFSIDTALEKLSLEVEESDDEEEHYSSDTNKPNEMPLQSLYVLYSFTENDKSRWKRKSLGFRVGESYLLTAFPKLDSYAIMGLRSVPTSDKETDFEILWKSESLECAILKLRKVKEAKPFLLTDFDPSKQCYNAVKLVQRHSVEIIQPVKLEEHLDVETSELLHYIDYDGKGILKGSPLFESTSTGYQVYGIIVGDLFLHGTKKYRVVLLDEVYECTSPIIPSQIRKDVFGNLTVYQNEERFLERLETRVLNAQPVYCMTTQAGTSKH